jgi:hypothetical protein
MGHVRRDAAHMRVGPTWASPMPPSPLSGACHPFLPGSPAPGTPRVPAPTGKTGPISGRGGDWSWRSTVHPWHSSSLLRNRRADTSNSPTLQKVACGCQDRGRRTRDAPRRKGCGPGWATMDRSPTHRGDPRGGRQPHADGLRAWRRALRRLDARRAGARQGRGGHDGPEGHARDSAIPGGVRAMPNRPSSSALPPSPGRAAGGRLR